MRMESTITTKGRATIPKAIRDHLGLKAGDRVKFFVHLDGSVVLLPKLPVKDLRNWFPSAKRSVSPQEMDQASEAGAARGFKRAKRNGKR